MAIPVLCNHGVSILQSCTKCEAEFLETYGLQSGWVCIYCKKSLKYKEVCGCVRRKDALKRK